MTDVDPSLFDSPAARRALQVEAEAYVERAMAMVNRARSIVDGDRLEAANLLAGRRAALADHLQRYQRFKHRQIFDPVIQRGTSANQIVARSMKVECVQMGELFSGYHARWLRLEPMEWRRYRKDMQDTSALLAAHLDAELAAIRKLLQLADFYKGVPGGSGKPAAVADAA